MDVTTFTTSLSTFVYSTTLTFTLLLFSNSSLNAIQVETKNPEQPKTAEATSNVTIVATVNGNEISENLVSRELAKSVGKLRLSDSQTEIARKATLERLINQHVVLGYLTTNQAGAGKNQIIEKMDELEAQLATVDQKLDDYLNQIKTTKPELEFKFAWQIAWQKFIDQKLTDQAIELHFNRNKRKFDGTELRVAHLLLKRKNPANSQSSQKSKAETIYDELRDGSLKWEPAVKQHSEAATAQSGGEMGWIKQSGPMPKSFTDAAFLLELNEISPPVETKFGHHIIKCVEVKSGKLGWKDNLKSVKSDATKYLFEFVVKAHRPKMTIKYLPE